MNTRRPIVLIAFGILLGASMGLADGVIRLCVWYMRGQLDSVIHRNWEISDIVSLTFYSALTGIVYGGLLTCLARPYARKLPLGRIYCFSMILAIPMFFIYYITIANSVSLRMVNFVPEILVFLLGVALALRIRNKKELQ